MKSVIVGTAGHIDHGKSALVRALTGVDPDRLEEEKRRGITIDLGFAHLELPSASGGVLQLAFVDVPGHERFVRNMLAGVGGIDIVVLVVAADESIKPQTVEHFDICRLLHVPHGLTVITKADLADQETLDLVRLELEDFLRGSFLDPACAPMITVSARTGAGLHELKRALAAMAAQVVSRDSGALPRLPVDRVFAMRGFGTVVTGTMVAGSIRKEDELEVFPTGRRVRVRGIQVHNTATNRVEAGQRGALNIAGAAVEDLARGMTLSTPGMLRTTRCASASVTLLAGTRPLRERARVHFHCYTTETIAEVFPLQGKVLEPGATAWAELRFAAPVLLVPGDRFILRQFSPVITIGGGSVLDAHPYRLPRRPRAPLREQTLAFLQTIGSTDAGSVLAARVARRGIFGLSVPDAVVETGWPPQRVEQTAAPLLQRRELVRCGSTLLTSDAFQQAAGTILAMVSAFHEANPLVPGIRKEQLREKLHLEAEVCNGMLDRLVAEGKLQVSGEHIQIPGRGLRLGEQEADSKRKIEHQFAAAGLRVPVLSEVIDHLQIDRNRAQKIVTLLLREGVLVKLADDLIFHRDALQQLRARVAAAKSRSPKIDVAGFKELAGVSRKYAIPLLEYLDREHVTRRVGDVREIL